jgi:DNA mismatch repair protein MutL
MRIRVLNPSVAALIAAGEVVERPASIVKELIENAIDAGAKAIRVTVPGDPAALVVVGDDGHGIDLADLELAFVRHATSKIPDDDVSRIATLGFRGEALFAASAVAGVRMVSRAAGCDSGWEVFASPSGVTAPSPAAGAQGTIVYVTDVFANVPARLKFMKSRRAELAAIRTVVDNAALTHPNLEFRLSAAGRETVYRPAATTVQRATSVIGEEIAADAVSISSEMAGITIEGTACVPTRFRKDRKGITVAVNGRVISDQIILSAVRDAYSGLIAPGHEPIAFVHLRLDPKQVDVNVNPRKSEVRFADPGEVHSAVVTAIRNALDGAGLMTSRKLAVMAANLAASANGDVSDRRRLPLGRVIGQANGSWIISETADGGIVVVDQHAAHERVLLENFRAAVGANRQSYRLTTPTVVKLRDEEIAVLQDNELAMNAAGFDLEFVPDAVFVTAVPDVMAGMDVAAVVSGIASAAVVIPARAVEARLTELMAEAGCHAAIKAGQMLSNEAADDLLREIEATPNGGQCNHGRPAIAFLSDSDLRRLFARS